jgi:hypothetical protein
MRHFTLSNRLIWPFLPNYYCRLKRILHIYSILTSITVNEYYLQHYAMLYHSFFHCLSCNANKLTYWIFLFALLPSKCSLTRHFAYIWMYFFFYVKGGDLQLSVLASVYFFKFLFYALMMTQVSGLNYLPCK